MDPRAARRALVLAWALVLGACAGDGPGAGDASVDALGDVGLDAGDAGLDASDAAPRDAAPDAPPPRCEPPAEPPSTCNLHEALCDRPYDEVSYATTHNAMSNREERWLAPNQNFSIRRQLEDGVRGLMLDAHYYMDQPVLCHNICSAGWDPLAEGLAVIADFLRCHPAEVVTIIFETYISAEDTLTAFEESGLLEYVHAQALGEPWPTLRELIDANERLVVLTDSDGGTYDWYHDVWDFAFETHYAAETPDDFSCDRNRGTSGADLFIFNHFLTAPLAAQSLAEMVNFDPFLIDRARECETLHDHRVSFVTVDFYDVGDVLTATDLLNGV